MSESQKGRSTGQRFERKFVTQHLSEAEVIMRIRQHPSFFSEIYSGRQINNIYFDTPGLQFYYDNISGSPLRKKVRIRWYGESLNEVQKPILEFKHKSGLTGWKRSFLLSDFRVTGQERGDFFQRIFCQSNLPEEIIFELRQLEPVILNRYFRRYFQSHDKRFRFTVDSNLRYRDFRKPSHADLQGNYDHWNRILELKYSFDHDVDAQFILNQLPIRLSKSSKYVNGVARFRSTVAV